MMTPPPDPSSSPDIRTEQGRRRVRAYLGGHLVVDTVRPLLVWERPHYPQYYLPREDFRAELVPAGEDSGGAKGVEETFGPRQRLHVDVAGRRAEGAAAEYPRASEAALRGHVRLEWNAMDGWFEEDEPVRVHPRDPYTRVDVLESSRHVRVELDGVTVADSRRPRILFETGLRPRYYLPLTDLRLDLLRPSDRRTECPYKGEASYFSVEVNGRRFDDVVWTYRTPLPEAQKIAGLACFYDERVDLFLDGERV